ncbi:hypothetical protein BDZ94DRAFT_1283875 [Collybia nuda]|uniref:DNA breaking-rejoining enzyme n=1 Tax=Collybia nuda TaxID=64659 RepID=A0A9P5XZR2_9AGAR|nr:hypothetical protein BDZ94DRAFT_1283875 [Collybia nuda]
MYPLPPTLLHHLYLQLFYLLVMQQKARHPPLENSWTPSPLRPVVPADRRLILWTTPHSAALQNSLDEIFKQLLAASTLSTRETYGAGLLRFTQFCDREAIAERLRMPASPILLSAFVADAIGSCTGECIKNWLSGLRLWHIFNRAEWLGSDRWVSSLQKSAFKVGAPFKRPPREPITRVHLHALQSALDISCPLDAAIWACALTVFWGCRRLGELTVKSPGSFTLEHDVSRGTDVSSTLVDGRQVLAFHLPWTKTTSVRGGECILTATGDELCPVRALYNHLAVNKISNYDVPLFSFVDVNRITFLTKSNFLKITSKIYSSNNLNHGVFGQSYRIGGSLELLTVGVAPEIVMKLGGWSSLCFLLYWRRLELLIPSAISRAWAAQQAEFAQKNSISIDDLDNLHILN